MYAKKSKGKTNTHEYDSECERFSEYVRNGYDSMADDDDSESEKEDNDGKN